LFTNHTIHVTVKELAVNAFLYWRAGDTPPVHWWQPQCHLCRLHTQNMAQLFHTDSYRSLSTQLTHSSLWAGGTTIM